MSTPSSGASKPKRRPTPPKPPPLSAPPDVSPVPFEPETIDIDDDDEAASTSAPPVSAAPPPPIEVPAPSIVEVEGVAPSQAPPVPEPAPPVVPVPTSFAGFLCAISLGALGLFASGQTTALGEDQAAAQVAVLAIAGAGILITWGAARARAQAATEVTRLPWMVERFAATGGALPETAAHAATRLDAALATVEQRVSNGSSALVLLGMVGTATWLAMQAPVFEEAARALADGKGAELGPTVAALLGLGPKAFLTTATAVAASVLVSFFGGRMVVSVRAVAPTSEAILKSWHIGRAEWQAAEEASTRNRDKAILDVALSNQSVRELNQALHTAAATFSGLGSTVTGIQEAAKRIGDAQATIQTLIGALKESESRSKDVASVMGKLAEEVRKNGEAMLETSKHFGNELLKSSRDEGARLAGEAVARSLVATQGEFDKLAATFHKSLSGSVDLLQNRAANEFSNAVRTSTQELEQMEQALARASLRMQGLTTEVARWTVDLEKNGSAFANALESLSVRLDPAGTTSAELRAVERAGAALTESTRQLSQAAAELRTANAHISGGLDTMRRQAETIGRAREVLTLLDERARQANGKA